MSLCSSNPRRDDAPSFFQHHVLPAGAQGSRGETPRRENRVGKAQELCWELDSY